LLLSHIPENRVIETAHERARMERYKVENEMKEEAQGWKHKMNEEIDRMFLELTPTQDEMDHLSKAYQDFKIVVD